MEQPKKRILVTAQFTDEQKKQMAARQEFDWTFKRDSEVVSGDLENADALIGNVDVSLLRDRKNIKWIQLNSSGVDAYARAGAVPENTVITCATGAYGLAISEYMVGMLMVMMKKIGGYLDAQKEARWTDLGSVDSPYGKRVLIVGCGNIGLEFAKRMRPFGCTIIGIKRRTDIKPDEVDEIYGLDALKEQVKLADIIALCLPGTAECYHAMDREALESCKEGAYLMNVGRGTAIDTKCLLEPSISKRFGGIWLDVCEVEPLPEGDPLYSVPGLLLTPHITGGYHLGKTVENIYDIAMHNLDSWANGTGDFIHVVSRENGYSLG